MVNYWKSASTLPVLTEKRTSTSIPINMVCHNKNKLRVREQKIHFYNQNTLMDNRFYKLDKIGGYTYLLLIWVSYKFNYVYLEIFIKNFNPIEIDRIVEMAWEDRTPFDAISFQFNLKEKEVIQLMRSNLKTSSFKMWRKRVTGRKTKHGFPDHKTRFKSPNQKWKLNLQKIVPLA